MPKFSRVKDFSFRLKHFLTYFLMFLESIYVEFSSASFRTFSKLNFLFLLHGLLLRWLISRCFCLRLTSCFFLGHLSLKDCHEVLISFDRNFFIRIDKLLFLRLFFGLSILDSLSRYRWRFFVCVLLLNSSLSNLRCWFFNLWLFIVFFFFLPVSSLFHWIYLIFSFLDGRISLIFLSTHPITTHLFL